MELDYEKSGKLRVRYKSTADENEERNCGRSSDHSCGKFATDVGKEEEGEARECCQLGDRVAINEFITYFKRMFTTR